jgi:guanylate kinase
MSKKLIFVTGWPGAQKRAVIKALAAMDELNCARTISMTTRTPRFGEHDGLDYYYRSKDEFLYRLEREEFQEYIKVKREDAVFYYGTLKYEIEKGLALDKFVLVPLDTFDGELIRYKWPEALSIFVGMAGQPLDAQCKPEKYDCAFVNHIHEETVERIAEYLKTRIPSPEMVAAA